VDAFLDPTKHFVYNYSSSEVAVYPYKDMSTLWHAKWPENVSIPFDEFMEVLLKYFHIKYDSQMPLLQSFKQLITNDSDAHVTPLTAKHMISWFGPITAVDGGSESSSGSGKTKSGIVLPFLERVQLILSQPWFFGKLDYRQSESRLGNNPTGTFLVRLNTGTSCEVEVSPYTIVARTSVKTTSNAASSTDSSNIYGSIGTPAANQHLRVYVTANNTGLIVKLDNSKYTAMDPYGIHQLISNLQLDSSSAAVFKTACPGSPFQKNLVSTWKTSVLGTNYT